MRVGTGECRARLFSRRSGTAGGGQREPFGRHWPRRDTHEKARSLGLGRGDEIAAHHSRRVARLGRPLRAPPPCRQATGSLSEAIAAVSR
jgi:hypothetical protein